MQGPAGHFPWCSLQVYTEGGALSRSPGGCTPSACAGRGGEGRFSPHPACVLKVSSGLVTQEPLKHHSINDENYQQRIQKTRPQRPPTILQTNVCGLTLWDTDKRREFTTSVTNRTLLKVSLCLQSKAALIEVHPPNKNKRDKRKVAAPALGSLVQLNKHSRVASKQDAEQGLMSFKAQGGWETKHPSKTPRTQRGGQRFAGERPTPHILTSRGWVKRRAHQQYSFSVQTLSCPYHFTHWLGKGEKKPPPTRPPRTLCATSPLRDSG